MAARRAIGLVPQEINFDPFFTSREVLRFQMGYYGVAPDEKRIDELLGAMDLRNKADANTRELSGGMKRRLLIAKALVHKPQVVFLDEPTAGVDISLRRDLWAYVQKLREGGTTIVLTTHYLEEAEALADRVAVIDHGRLVTLDTPAVLLARHGRKRVRLRFTQPIAAAAAGAGGAGRHARRAAPAARLSAAGERALAAAGAGGRARSPSPISPPRSHRWRTCFSRSPRARCRRESDRF